MCQKEHKRAGLTSTSEEGEKPMAAQASNIPRRNQLAGRKNRGVKGWARGERRLCGALGSVSGNAAWAAASSQVYEREDGGDERNEAEALGRQQH